MAELPPTFIPTPNYATPLLDTSKLGNLGTAYHEGNQQARTRNLQNAFKDGLPYKDGQLDIAAMTDTLARMGGLESAMPLVQQKMLMDAVRGGMSTMDGNNAGAGNGQGQPDQNAATLPPPKQPIPAHGIPPPAPDPKQSVPDRVAGNTGKGDQAGSLMSVIDDAGVPADQAGIVAKKIADRYKLDPNAPLPDNVKGAVGNMLLAGGYGKPMITAQGGPTASQPPAEPAPGVQPPPGMSLQDASRLRNEATGMRKQGLGLEALKPGMGKALLDEADRRNEQAKQITEVFAKNSEKTGPQKEAGEGRLPGESLPDYLARAKSLEKIGEKVGEGIGASVAEVIDAGRSSQKRIQQLAIIGDALKRGEGNISTGPFAEFVLKGKQALDSAFNLGLAGVPEAEVAQKAGFGLATQAVKEISGRPSQMEFLRGLQNNPGLLLSPRGSVAMIDILTQTARQDAELARIAQRRENWSNWQDVQDAYYKSHPIMSPFDKKRPLGLEDAKVLEREAKDTIPATQAKTSSPTISAKADYDKLKPGSRFMAPDKTGKLVEWSKP